MNKERVEEEKGGQARKERPCRGSRDLKYLLPTPHSVGPQERTYLQTQGFSHFCSQEALSFHGNLFFWGILILQS